MPKILLAECMQEISSLNPVPSDYSYFHIERGEELLRQRGLNTAIGGALAVFEAHGAIDLIPTYGARSGSAGLLSAAGWRQLRTELLAAVVKCPHTEYQMYDAWVQKNFNIDAPGATSADLRSLGHRICSRPVFPLDDVPTYEPHTVLYHERRRLQQ